MYEIKNRSLFSSLAMRFCVLLLCFYIFTSVALKTLLLCTPGWPARIHAKPFQLCLISRITQPEEDAAVGCVYGQCDGVGSGGVQNGCPIGSQTGIQIIGLHLQTPASMIHRPAQLNLPAGRDKAQGRRCRGNRSRGGFG